MPELLDLTSDDVNKKKVLSLGLRVAFSVGLLIFLYAQVPQFDTAELLPDWNDATPRWLAAAIGLTLVSQVMSTLRWQQAADAIGVHGSLRRLFSHYMAGLFISNFVPTTVGGDVLRVNRLSRDTGDGPGAFASVVFERLSGWLVLPIVSLIGFLLNPSLRGLGASTRVAFIVGGVTLAALGVVIALAGSDMAGDRLERRQGWLEWINAVHRGIDSLRDTPSALWRILGAGFAYQGVMILAAWCAARAIGIQQLGPTALFALFPAVLILQVLPLGIGGLGVREGALVFFFSALDVPDEQSIALGLLLYFLTLASSLIGLPMLVFGNRGNGTEVGTEAAQTAAP